MIRKLASGKDRLYSRNTSAPYSSSNGGDRMTTARTVGSLCATLMVFVGGVLPDVKFADGMRYLGLGYIVLDFLLMARTGYRRRRAHWTRDSWRRFFAVCAIPVGALLILAWMLAALEWRLPIVGAARSSVRALWAAGSIVLLLIGAGGFAVAIGWLAEGEPSRQFTWPRT